jgi:hypothetical protein
VLIVASIHVGQLVMLHEAAWEDDCMLAGLRGGGSYGRGVHYNSHPNYAHLSYGGSGRGGGSGGSLSGGVPPQGGPGGDSPSKTGSKSHNSGSPGAETETVNQKSSSGGGGGGNSVSSTSSTGSSSSSNLSSTSQAHAGRFSELKSRSATLAREKGLAGGRKTQTISFSRARDVNGESNLTPGNINNSNLGDTNPNTNSNNSNESSKGGNLNSNESSKFPRKSRKAFIDLSGNSLDLFLAAYPDAKDFELFTVDCESGGSSGNILAGKDKTQSTLTSSSSYVSANAYDPSRKMRYDSYDENGTTGLQAPKYFHLSDELSGFGVDRCKEIY